MKQLLAVLLLVPSMCLTQIPDYVPTDGLVAWYPLDGNGSGSTFASGDAAVMGAQPTTDRFGNPAGAMMFDGNDNLSIPSSPWNVVSPQFSFSIWYNVNAPGSISTYIVEKGSTSGGWEYALSFEPNGEARFIIHEPDGSGGYLSFQGGQIGEGWNHVGFSFDMDGASFLILNDEIVAQPASPNGNDPQPGTSTLNLGARRGWANHPDPYGGLDGALDDFAFWNRALTPSEMQAMYDIQTGCLDTSACNYNPLAAIDDGTCVSCELLASACGEGTVWDSTLAQCISIADTVFIEPDACVPSCGEGTVWNPVLHECVVAIPADVDLSGCITAGDILALLAAFGTCPPAPDFPDTPEDALWTCGDLVEYWGYAYETVAIGTQCWFAENLKSTKFRDGEELILAQSDSSWEANAWTYAYCTVEGTSNNLEFLYKGGVVENPIEICPSGWHIPFDQDWMDLETELGMPDSALTLIGTRGSNELVGGRMKSNSTYWDSPNVLASDPSGFNAEPCGYRNHLGYLYDQNATTHFWNSDPQGGNDSHARVLFHDLGGVYRYGWDMIGGTLGQRFGRSIRCIKD